MIENKDKTETLNQIVDEPVKWKWNWGAFWLTWIWGIFNGVWISLLALIPIVNIVVAFILGIKGTEWAQKSKTHLTKEENNKIQKKWSIAGWVISIICISTILNISYEKYQSNQEILEMHEEVMSQLYANNIDESILNESTEILILGFTGFSTDYYEMIESYSLLLNNEYEIYLVTANLVDNTMINYIEITKFEDDDVIIRINSILE